MHNTGAEKQVQIYKLEKWSRINEKQEKIIANHATINMCETKPDDKHFCGPKPCDTILTP